VAVAGNQLAFSNYSSLFLSGSGRLEAVTCLFVLSRVFVSKKQLMVLEWILRRHRNQPQEPPQVYPLVLEDQS
jgi:hypothetical protein